MPLNAHSKPRSLAQGLFPLLKYSSSWLGGREHTRRESEEHLEEHADHSRRDSKDPGKMPEMPRGQWAWASTALGGWESHTWQGHLHVLLHFPDFLQ